MDTLVTISKAYGGDGAYMVPVFPLPLSLPPLSPSFAITTSLFLVVVVSGVVTGFQWCHKSLHCHPSPCHHYYVLWW